MSNAQVEQAAQPSEVVKASAVKGVPHLLGKDVIKTDQDGIRRNLVSLDTQIHANAVQCMLHAEKHGDTSLMRRLLVDIIDAKSGYRRQGIIAWMREFSPMELSGDVIKLSGTLNGEPRPFRCEQANLTPFTELSSAKEFVMERPVFRDNLTSQVERAVKAYRSAVDNTIISPGQAPKPKDPKKPFFNGLHLDKMEDVFAKIEGALSELSSLPDATKDVYDARQALAKAERAAKATI